MTAFPLPEHSHHSHSLGAFPLPGGAQAPSLQLPSLADTFLLIGHGKKAELVWTRAEFLSLCEYMMNDNPRCDFLMAFQRKAGDLREPYAKSKKPHMERHAAWTWDCIVGRAKTPAGIGFYPTNANRQSRWAAMDFDSHDGNTERARRLALTAFQCLLNHPELFLILSTSGGGWHLFIFATTFHPVESWTRLLRQVASLIGSPIGKGILEIFPDEGRGQGKAIRAPGTWNPKRDTFSLVCYQNVLPLLHTGERVCPSLYLSTAGGKRTKLTDKKDLRCEEALRRHAISVPNTRRDRLKDMVSELYRFYSRQTVEALAKRQFLDKAVSTAATVEEHLSDFASIWSFWIDRYNAELYEAEKRKEGMLVTEGEKEAFRLAWGFAHINPGKDFAYSTEHFARNLGISTAGSSKQRLKFVRLGIIRESTPFRANVHAARFHWTADA